MEPINNPETDNTSRAYWEEVLRSHGLSMRKGSQPRKRSGKDQINEMVFVGGLNNLVGIEEQETRKETGQVHPAGRGPDSYEQKED